MTSAPSGPSGSSPRSGTDPETDLDRLDPLGLRTDAPLFDAFLRRWSGPLTPFTIPGHKQRTDLVGPIVAGDLPLHGGVDTVRLSGDLLGRAERLAADHWGLDRCRYSTGGSTHGNQALALTVARPGDAVVVSRTLHRSLLLGLVLAGLEPIWVSPTIDPLTGLPGAVSPVEVATALDRRPDARAMFVGDPSYLGVVGDIAGMADVAHHHGVPLVVDAAWGAHLGAHPALPPHPVTVGADAVVMSAHKTLPAMSPGAIVGIRTDRLDPDRFERAVDATHTTSPSGPVLASIDASRALLARHGERLYGALIDLVAGTRARFAELDGVRVLDRPDVDPTKLVIALDRPIGLELDDHLDRLGVPVEMADPRTIIPIVTIADDEATIATVVDAFVECLDRVGGATNKSAHAADGPSTAPPGRWTIEPEVAMSPRDAFFADHDTVPTRHAVGRVSAELIAPYPPGIPVLAPGERITSELLDVLDAARTAGTRVAYAADATLATVQVVAEDPTASRPGPNPDRKRPEPTRPDPTRPDRTGPAGHPTPQCRSPRC